jgi:hypothetical protein
VRARGERAPTGWPHRVEGEGVRARARAGKGNGADRRVPPCSEKGSGRAWARKLGRAGPDAEGGLKTVFPFSFEFLIYFHFIFSMELKSNLTTIQIQIFQTCASTKNKV